MESRSEFFFFVAQLPIRCQDGRSTGFSRRLLGNFRKPFFFLMLGIFWGWGEGEVASFNNPSNFIENIYTPGRLTAGTYKSHI